MIDVAPRVPVELRFTQGWSMHPGQADIAGGLIRMSFDCEAVEDVWADLEHALGGLGFRRG